MATKCNTAKREAGKVSAKNTKKAKPKNHMSAWFQWDYGYDRIYICTNIGFCAPLPTNAALAVIHDGYEIRQPDDN